jgi:integrase
MRKAVSARSVNYELRLLRGVMVHANWWKGNIAERYKALKQSKDRIGRVATKEQLMKIIETARQNEYWLLAMYCAAVAAGTGCRSWEIKNLQLQPEALQRCLREHLQDLQKRNIRSATILAVFNQFCYVPKHTVGEQLLQVREAKREKAAYESATLFESGDP